MSRPFKEEFELKHPNFRGSNDKRVDYWTLPRQIVDTVDVGLFGQVEVSSTGLLNCDKVYFENEKLWTDLLNGTVSQGDTVSLEDFQMLEWLPFCPGRYFTPEASAAREHAEEFWNWGDGEFLPLGKSEMVLGGVGCVRLAPRTIRDGEVCFFGATSNGIGHQGIPVIVPLDAARQMYRRIKFVGFFDGNITGTLWPLPLDKSPLKFDRKVPKYYLFAERIRENGRRRSNPLVTVAITFSSSYEGETKRIRSIDINQSKNWSFASFNPTDGLPALRQTVKWLEGYAVRHTRQWKNGELVESRSEELSIVGDFDEVFQHFKNPIEFPLSSILGGQYDARIVQFYSEALRIEVNQEIVKGDKFENVQNSTIINRSKLREAQFAIQSHGKDVGDVLDKVAAIVEASRNAAAISLFDNLVGEFQKPEPSKSVLKQFWIGLTKLLPDIAKIAGAAAKIGAVSSSD